MWSRIISKWKRYRRRHKFTLLVSLAVVCLFTYSLYRNNFDFDEWEIDIESSLIESQNFKSLFAWGKKTVPFSQTSAAQESELNIDIDNFQVASLSKKLAIIAKFENNFFPQNAKNQQKADKFFRGIFELLFKSKPVPPKLNRYKVEERIYHARYNSKEDDAEDNKIVFNEEYLSRFLDLNPEELAEMTKAHKMVTTNLPKKGPRKMYRGNGIVYVGGGKFNWLTLLSIKNVRDLGAQLPIEVVIPTIEEYDATLCFKVFPKYNARCILLPSVLNKFDDDVDNVYKKFDFKGYQYKALALLISSFENILFLDGDNTAIRNPDHLFAEQPFAGDGLIVWPDFWKRATSPLYYKIAGIDVKQDEYLPRYNELLNDYIDVDYKSLPQDQVPFHQRKGAIPDPTSESGQLMISKKSHLDVLILALYYNLYGPSHYYPLFSQGSDGEGDKETFLAASVALGNRYYQVRQFTRALGYFDEERRFVGTGMGQYNPVNDYHKSEPDLLFIHTNFPKFNPWDLKLGNKIYKTNGDRIRLQGNAIKKEIQFDFEFRQWTNMHYFLCELQIPLDAFKHIPRHKLCEEVKAQFDYLKSTTTLMEDN